MMESFPNYLSTSSSSTFLPIHQMLISRASELAVPDRLPMFRDASANDMSVDATSSMKDNVLSRSKTFHVDGSAHIGMDGLEKNKVIETGASATPGRGDYDKKKKTRSRRFAFQTRSQVDILDDGYRWRKYGQKAVKNNKFPRSYYRCTHQGCKVKKQIQRLTRDEGVVVTTYEGIHSHPIEKSTDNFEHILTQMKIYTSY